MTCGKPLCAGVESSRSLRLRPGRSERRNKLSRSGAKWLLGRFWNGFGWVWCVLKCVFFGGVKL